MLLVRVDWGQSMSIPSTDVARLLVGLRVFVYAGALLRFALHWNDTQHTAAYGLALSALCLGVGLVEVFSRSPRSRAWRIFEIYADVACITALYILTGSIESDFFILYYLPLIGAAQELNPKRRRQVAALAGFGLTTAVTYVAYAAHHDSYARLLVSVVLPRGFALLVFALISSHLIKARSALPGALSEIVRATASATKLDRELDELLDEAIGLGFDHAAVALVDKPMGDIRMVRARGLPPRQLAMSHFRLTDPDIMGSIVQNARTEAFAAGVRDPRFDERIYEAFGHAQLARVFTPIITSEPDSMAIGLIECGRKRPDSDDWVVSMKEKVEGIARRHADAIGSNLTHVLLAAIAQRAIQVIDADSATIHVYQHGRLRYQAGAGRADQAFLERFPPRTDGIGIRSIEDAKPIPLDGDELRRAQPELFACGVRAMTAFPLLNLGAPELRGVLYVHFWKASDAVSRAIDDWAPALSRRRFTKRTIDIEKLFAEQLEGIIQNYLSLRYSADAAERTWQVSLLQNFIQSLASKHASPSLLHEIAGGALLYLPECDCVTLYQYFHDQQRFDSPPVMAGNFLEPDAMQIEVGPEEARGLLAIEETRFLTDVRAYQELTVPHQTRPRARFVDRELRGVSIPSRPIRTSLAPSPKMDFSLA
jgi:hypothetical protein